MRFSFADYQWTFLLCALLVLPLPAKAEWMDGKQLHILYRAFSAPAQGQSDAAREASAMYLGYVTGVVNATDALAQNKIYCLPPLGAGTSNEQLAHVVGAYITAHPAEQNEPAMLLIFKALKNVFPCH